MLASDVPRVEDAAIWFVCLRVRKDVLGGETMCFPLLEQSKYIFAE